MSNTEQNEITSPQQESASSGYCCTQQALLLVWSHSWLSWRRQDCSTPGIP